MTEKNKQIIEMVEKEYSLNEISSKVGLSNKQVHSRIISLNRIGMNFERQFFYNGDVTYKLVKDIKSRIDTNEIDLYTSHEDVAIRIVVVSDLHFGNEKARLDALNEIYNYCINNKIHIILNAGDLIDGSYGTTKRNYEDIGNQIEFMFKKHPFDKNILNFILLGNHDITTLKSLGIDLKDFLNNRRPDLISMGYGRGVVNIKNEQLILRHNIPGFKPGVSDQNKIVLIGHNHQVPKFNNSGLDINYFVGSLSDFNGNNKLPPTAVDIQMTFYNGYMKDINFKQLYYVDKKMSQFFEIQKYVGNNKPFVPIKPVNLECEYPANKVKKLEK